MPHIVFEEKKIHFHTKGEGQAIVFLHGFCEDRSMWTDFTDDFLTDYQLIFIDLPGFGDSEVIENCSIKKMASIIYAVIESLKIEAFFLVGHSMGGYVSLAFAEEYSSTLRGLILFHSHPFEDAKEKRQNRQKGIDFVNRMGTTLYIKQLIPALFTPSFARSNTIILEKLTYNAIQYPTAGITNALAAMRDRPDRSNVLKTISCPVQFIIGKEDQAVTFAQSLDQTFLPKIANIQILEKVGHMGMFEATPKTQRMLKDFVQFCENVTQ